MRNRGKRKAKDRHEREMGSSLTCFCFLIEFHFHFTLIWGINGGLWGKEREVLNGRKWICNNLYIWVC